MSIGEILVQHGTRLMVHYLSASVRNGPPPPPQTEDRGRVEHEQGCPVCRMHRMLAEADRLMAGMAERAEAGEVPHHLRSTLLLVKHSLEAARAKLPEIERASPGQRDELRRLDAALAEALLILPSPNGATKASILAADATVGECWKLGYAVSDHYFDREAGGLLERWYADAVSRGLTPEQATAELRDRLELRRG